MQTQMHNTETSRKRAIEVEVGELNEGMWVHFSFHSEVGLDGTERNRKFLRTTLLLAELEGEVKMVSEQRQRGEERELKLSLELAQQFPMTLDEADAETDDSTQASHSTSAQPLPEYRESMLSFRQLIEQQTVTDSGDPEKLRAALLSVLPFPLTRVLLHSSYKELGAGAVQSIEACLHCWRQETLGTDELLNMLKSFASQSDILQKCLEPIMTSNEGEVATLQQMCDLTEMMCQSNRE